MKENGVLVALFVLVFLILGFFWWFNRQGDNFAPISLRNAVDSPELGVEFDQTAIKNALLKNHNQSQDKINLSSWEIEGNYARGSVSFSGDDRVWLWLARQSEKWQLVHDGQGLPSCQVLTETNFPNNLARECWDEEKQLVVNR